MKAKRTISREEDHSKDSLWFRFLTRIRPKANSRPSQLIQVSYEALSREFALLSGKIQHSFQLISSLKKKLSTISAKIFHQIAEANSKVHRLLESLVQKKSQIKPIRSLLFLPLKKSTSKQILRPANPNFALKRFESNKNFSLERHDQVTPNSKTSKIFGELQKIAEEDRNVLQPAKLSTALMGNLNLLAPPIIANRNSLEKKQVHGQNYTFSFSPRKSAFRDISKEKHTESVREISSRKFSADLVKSEREHEKVRKKRTENFDIASLRASLSSMQESECMKINPLNLLN